MAEGSIPFRLDSTSAPNYKNEYFIELLNHILTYQFIHDKVEVREVFNTIPIVKIVVIPTPLKSPLYNSGTPSIPTLRGL